LSTIHSLAVIVEDPAFFRVKDPAFFAKHKSPFLFIGDSGVRLGAREAPNGSGSKILVLSAKRSGVRPGVREAPCGSRTSVLPDDIVLVE
jgi:hypothetical protein